MLAESNFENQEKDLQLDSCSNNFNIQNESEAIRVEKTNNGNLCYLSDTATHPGCNLEVAAPLTPLHIRKASTSSQLTWNYDKNKEKSISGPSNRLKSIQYADDISSIFTETTIKLSKNYDFFTNDNDNDDNESLTTIVVQPKSVRIAESNSMKKLNGFDHDGMKQVSPKSQKSPVHIENEPTAKEKIKNFLYTIVCAWNCWPPFVKIQVKLVIK